MPAFRKKPRDCQGLNCAAARTKVDRIRLPEARSAGTHRTSTPGVHPIVHAAAGVGEDSCRCEGNAPGCSQSWQSPRSVVAAPPATIHNFDYPRSASVRCRCCGRLRAAPRRAGRRARRPAAAIRPARRLMARSMSGRRGTAESETSSSSARRPGRTSADRSTRPSRRCRAVRAAARADPRVPGAAGGWRGRRRAYRDDGLRTGRCERPSVAGEARPAAEDGAGPVIVEPGTLRHTLGRIGVRYFLRRPLAQVNRQRVHRAERGHASPAGRPRRHVRDDSLPVKPSSPRTTARRSCRPCSP